MQPLVINRKRTFGLFVSVMLATAATHAFATGMQPETSIIILNEADGETSINVKNTDSTVSLLHSVIESTPEDQDALVLLTPPVARVEPDEAQLVRFLLKPGEALKVQRLKRVVFEGIPQRSKVASQATVGVTVRQNLPLIVHPAGLAPNREPWTLLKWQVKDGKLVVVNDSAYVVRLDPTVVMQPSGEAATLSRGYVLPGETLTAASEGPAAGSSVAIIPATVYGYQVDKYEAPVSSIAP